MGKEEPAEEEQKEEIHDGHSSLTKKEGTVGKGTGERLNGS